MFEIILTITLTKVCHVRKLCIARHLLYPRMLNLSGARLSDEGVSIVVSTLQDESIHPWQHLIMLDMSWYAMRLLPLLGIEKYV